MRDINLNGYIDDEVWFGDEITPDGLHEALYGTSDAPFSDDVHIRLNSYGGSCNAATRMFDDIRAYPGNVLITVSGTAASAATVLSMAANKLEMTPGSLFMIHDPSTVAWGNENDLQGAIDLLRACKESILNVYAKRCKKARNEIAAMMTATTWMDAQSALSNGFIDSVVDDEESGALTNSARPHITDLKEAKEKVQAWFDRHTPHKPQLSRPVQGEEHTSAVTPADEREKRPVNTGGTVPLAVPEEPEQEAPAPSAPQDDPAPIEQPEETGSQPLTGTPVAQLQNRLGLIMPAKRSN